MDLPLIVLVIVGIILLLLILKITAKIFRIILSISFILFLVVGVLGYFVYKDVRDLKENIAEEDSVFLMQEDDVYLTGFIGKFGDDTDAEGVPFDAITSEGLASFTTQSYESILGDRYKLFVLGASVFDDVDEVSFEDETFTREEALSLLESDDPLGDLGMPTEVSGFDNDEFKAALFGMLLAKAIEKEGPKFFISGIKSEQITVHPETITFKLLRLLP